MLNGVRISDRLNVPCSWPRHVCEPDDVGMIRTLDVLKRCRIGRGTPLRQAAFGEVRMSHHAVLEPK
jgi:hypothetical protein